MINPLWLRTFCTLVDVGHFTKTAERLHMTQSGVSQQVRKLEAHLGCLLLARHGKQFSCTDAGERLYREANEILQALGKLEAQLAADPAYEGLVRLMSPGSLGLKLYPELLQLQRQHPKLVIDYRFAPNADVEVAVAEGDVDIGFMTRSPMLAEVGSRPVGQEALLLVTPAALEAPNWAQLSALGFVDHPDGAHHARLMLGVNYPEYQSSQALRRVGFSNQIGLILEPVSLGLGFTVLPAYAVAAFSKPALIRTHTLTQPVSETLFHCFRRHYTAPNRVQTVLDKTMAWLQ
jgi:LysR family transcriptional regulator, transcriptional activator of the cysJI operon